MGIETIITQAGRAIDFSEDYYFGFSKDGSRVGLMSKTDPNESPLSVDKNASAGELFQLLAMATRFGKLPAQPADIIGALFDIKIPA